MQPNTDVIYSYAQFHLAELRAEARRQSIVQAAIAAQPRTSPASGLLSLLRALRGRKPRIAPAGATLDSLVLPDDCIECAA